MYRPAATRKSLREVALGGELHPHGAIPLAGDHVADVPELWALQARLAGRRAVGEPGKQVEVGLADLPVHGAAPADVGFRDARMERELRHDTASEVSPVRRRVEPEGGGVLLP